MSGIAAIIRFDGGDADSATLSRMTAGLSWHAPDGAVQRLRGGAGFAYAGTAASQPLASRDGAVLLVFDGYLANFEELQAELFVRGEDGQAATDAELVRLAFARWGPDFARHLDGEFALVLWDEQRRTAFCARDHHGLRPLYWHWDGRVLVVASDVAAVLAGLPQEPPRNLGYLAEIAADVFYSADETVWQGIARLLPAHVMTAGAGGVRLSEYWTLPTTVDILYRREEDYFAHYREVLSQSIRRASRSDAPVACEVSGGLDSSSVYCMALGLQRAGRLPAPGLRGYSLSGPPGSAADEIDFARLVGTHTHTNIAEHPLFLPPLEWFAERAALDRDLPPLPNAAMSLTLDEAAVNDGCRVSLTGIGGDQWLDGTHYYYSELFERRQWAQLFACYRADVRAGGVVGATWLLARLGPGSIIPHHWRRALRGLLGGAPRHAAEAGGWMQPPFRQELAQRRERYEASLPDDYRASYKLRKLRHPSWAIVLDAAVRQRAHSGLEMRSPMMSRSFIEFSARTPEHWRLFGDVSKYGHRRALAGILPDLVAARESKAEFSSAYAHLASAIEEASLSKVPMDKTGLFDAGTFASIFETNRAVAIDERCYGEIWGSYATLLMVT